MKLWSSDMLLNKEIEEFTIGEDPLIDLNLVKYDLTASIAHVKMLHKIGLLSQDDCLKIEKELELLLRKAENHTFIIEDGVEDMHSQIEKYLIKKLGDLGKRVHTARSRNDQVLVALHLFAKDRILNLVHLLDSLFHRLQEKSEQFKDVYMPGYTHTQIAMPSSFGLWFGSFAETFVNDLELLYASYRIADCNPLGSAAGYGSSVNIDRKYTTKLLDFRTLHFNSIAAHISRGKLEMQMSYAMGSIAMTINKLCSDICLFNSQNFGFITLPDDYTTGSSIMPHKKNPDVFELFRSETNLLMTVPYQISSIVSNLITGYHRDYQLIKPVFSKSVLKLERILYLLTKSIEKIEVNTAILEDKKYNPIFSVEVVNRLVRKGIPFREAYFMVSEKVKESATHRFPEKIDHTHIGSVGNLCNDKIKDKWTELKNKFPIEE